ncbi:pyruvate, phosphate dikinase, partial [bacterium]|nr:pyruvate, phosphate dikinase [bacterium]
QEKVDIDLSAVDRKACFLCSDKAMGNGRERAMVEIVSVDPATFDRSKTVEMAEEIESLDRALGEEGRRYILIGPGRWGTRDRWLGIPVTFSQISRAKIIAEADLPDFVVDSSLGSHFFHNVTSMDIGYLKISRGESSFIDWDWLRSMPMRRATKHCRWTRLETPADVLMDGKTSVAVILKPDASRAVGEPGSIPRTPAGAIDD